jgi:UDP-N-acetylglucosamine--N-acetylmuramyl-(pentapeptide) pyrophosphoryl-undecaprenol N-acetylglucosamine transferase
VSSKRMNPTRVVLTGGGTGGHITPIVAVAHELKAQNPDCYIIYIGEKGSKFAGLTNGNETIDEVRTIFAGKLRRYHGESWLRRIFDVRTNFFNLRDAVYLTLGLLQSLFLIRRLKPDVVFLKGGFVGVPVGLSSAFWRIPFVTHDSDAMPGLANRMVAKWAKYHATGMPAEFYSYPKESTRYVGVLVGGDYRLVSEALQQQYKADVGIEPKSRVLLVTGGSLGARRLNDCFRRIADDLLNDYDDLYIVHQVGKGNLDVYEGYEHERLKVVEFLKPMYKYTGAADVVVTRAGANTLAELAVQGRALVVVPNPLLTGGHQLKNAELLVEKGAVLAVDETEFKQGPNKLDEATRILLSDEKRRHSLSSKLQDLSVPDAAAQLAVLLLEVGKH